MLPRRHRLPAVIFVLAALLWTMWQWSAPEPDSGNLATVSPRSTTAVSSTATAVADANRERATSRVTGAAAPDPKCFHTPSFPKTPLEQEVERIYWISVRVMNAINATYWPTDATLLGMMRNGRIVTDRDVDMQIHSTYKGCAPLLNSLRDHFARHAKIKSFKVVLARHPTYGRIGRYAMIRLFREFGTFDTGVDFNCVYTDDPAKPTYHVHRGTLEPVPLAVYPLGQCMLYGRVVPCPKDGYSVLESLKPRYDGCMVFPHCLGEPTISTKRCMSPHPTLPLEDFVKTTQELERCGFTSLARHYEQEPSCKRIMERNALACEMAEGGEICFVQSFKG
jgi:hypothetical protein